MATSLVDLLVLHGADLNLANNQGATPLNMAAQNGQLKAFKFLVERGAVVDQANVKGLTGNLEVVDFLLSA